MKHILLFLLLFISSFSFGQEENIQKVEIESGTLSKKYISGNLESFTVEMYTVNSGKVSTFVKKSDTITIRNGEKSDAVIKIYFKNKMQIRELSYKNKIVAYSEAIDFELNNLPINNTIYSLLVNNKIESSINKFSYENLDENFDDSMIKLFNSMHYISDLTTIDSVFSSIADFFSNGDALYKVYMGSYAEKHMPPITAYLKTNEGGKIESGIIWKKKDDLTGKYEIYSKEKIIKSEIQSLTDFKKIFQNYYAKNAMNK
ncbi:hypothetical protein [Flavobacterium branchiicola]|uniref:DUF4412 domain-containing protein n=1 Tax=Flavobacterium branchiicola TaxID=1114875 RepID=A0ABV9PAD5_9FLAO|nr:hypothetical protein [Flavobacterium branchiicola]MBS7253671.1 hypothetical protein [Flavobacterium branchiicola]